MSDGRTGTSWTELLTALAAMGIIMFLWLL